MPSSDDSESYKWSILSIVSKIRRGGGGDSGESGREVGQHWAIHTDQWAEV